MDSTMKEAKDEELRVSPERESDTAPADNVNPLDEMSPKPARHAAKKRQGSAWLGGVRLAPGGQEEIAALTSNAGVVHVFEERSRTDLTILRMKYKSAGLTVPESSFRVNKEGQAASDDIPSPDNPKTIMLGAGCDIETLAGLIRVQRSLDYPIVLTPQLFLYERKASEKEAPGWFESLVGFSGKTGFLRKWYLLLRSRGKVIISAADPIDLKEFLSRSEVVGLPELAVARMLLDTLRMEFREERRVVLGPYMHGRERMKNLVKRHHVIAEAVKQEVAAGERAEWEIWNEVDRHLDEIMADYDIYYIRLWDKVLNWVWKRFFGGVVVDKVGLERTRRAVRKAPVIYVPCHRSHADYLLVSHVLFQNEMTPPLIAAGANLNFGPLGYWFRKSGAFFLKRSFAGKAIYSATFESYLLTIIREGFNIEFYIEGGRSRTGKMFLPKMGILGMLIRAFERGELTDLSFVPISISYDRIPEEGEMLRETQAASEKVKFVKELREIMKKNFGRIHVNFAPPISMKEFLTEREVEHSTMEIEERRALYRDFAFRVIHAINQVSVITPSSVMNSALLARPAPGVEEEQLIADATLLLDYMKADGNRLAPTLRNPRAALGEALRMIRSARDIKEINLPGGDKDDKLISIEPDKRPNMEYYKNGTLHRLYQPAFVACSILSRHGEEVPIESIEEDYATMSKIFKYELVYDSFWPNMSEVEKVLGIFEEKTLVEVFEAGDGEEGKGFVRPTEAGLETLTIFSGQIENFIEAYLFTIEELPELFGLGYFTIDDCVKKLMKSSVKAFMLGRIERRESISAVTFKNAMSMMAHLGLIEQVEGDAGKKPRWRMSPSSEYLEKVYQDKLKRLGRIV